MGKYREYFTLIARESYSEKWTIEFGDYHRSVVKAELRDYRDHGYKAVNLMIITTDHTSEAIAKRVGELNAKKVPS